MKEKASCEPSGEIVEGPICPLLAVSGKFGLDHVRMWRNAGCEGLLLSSASSVDEHAMELIAKLSPKSLTLNNVQLPMRKLRLADLASDLLHLHLSTKGEFDVKGLEQLKVLGTDFERVTSVQGVDSVASQLIDINFNAPPEGMVAMLTSEVRHGCRALRFRRLRQVDCMFLRCFPSIRGLMLVDCRTMKSLDGIGRCGDLEDISITNVHISDINELAGLARLSRLFLESCGPLQSLMPLAGLNRLKQIVLSGSTKVVDGRVGWLIDKKGLLRVTIPGAKHYDAPVGVKIGGDITMPPLMAYWRGVGNAL